MPLWDQLKIANYSTAYIFKMLKKHQLCSRESLKKYFKEEEHGLQPSLFSLQWRSRGNQIPLQGGDTLY